MVHDRFYRELGRYLYAMALSDGYIQPRESRKLDQAVSHALKGLCGKHSRQAEVVLAKLSFHRCAQEQVPAAEAEKSFLEFIRANAHRIGKDEKQMAFTLIHKLAGAWGGIRSRESEMEKAVHEILDGANERPSE